jgi:choline dehydrogenase-like flavoprotein
VQAPRLVLAAGAVENARLLLVACAGDGGVADRSGWLGRGFMEHPRDRALTLMPSDAGSYRALGFYDMHGAADGTTIVGRLGLEAETARRGDLLNASATLFPIVRPHRARLRTALGRAGTMQALRRWLPAGGHGWSSHPEPGRVFDGFSVLLNVEQPPRAENAIVLGDRRDVHGTPLPVLHWRWHPEDHARLERLRRVIAQSLEGAGIGRVTIDAAARPDPNARHHAGTTRMDVDARHGVVDADGRVHGTDTLFVVGASTFPTAGFANPMLTIVAMALRLAEKLRAER